MGKVMICQANALGEITDGCDLDDSIHEGFTVGNGKVMYWYFIWHKSGNATVYTPEFPMRRRYIKGNQLINVHFKS